MNESSTQLTVYFDDPFWVGVFEHMEDGTLSICKVTFGADPKDYDVWEFVQRHYYALRFSSAIKTEVKQTADNPKRRRRNVKKQLQNVGIGTKSQQVLAAQREMQKTEHRKVSKAQKEAEQQRRFEMKQQKRKEKHRGH